MEKNYFDYGIVKIGAEWADGRDVTYVLLGCWYAKNGVLKLVLIGYQRISPSRWLG